MQYWISWLEVKIEVVVPSIIIVMCCIIIEIINKIIFNEKKLTSSMSVFAILKHYIDLTQFLKISAGTCV